MKPVLAPDQVQYHGFQVGTGTGQGAVSATLKGGTDPHQALFRTRAHVLRSSVLPRFIIQPALLFLGIFSAMNY